LLAFALAEAKAPRRNSERNIEQRRCDADLQDYHGCALCDALINPRRKIGDASFVPASKRNVGRSEFPISHLLLRCRRAVLRSSRSRLRFLLAALSLLTPLALSLFYAGTVFIVFGAGFAAPSWRSRITLWPKATAHLAADAQRKTAIRIIHSTMPL